MNLEAELRQIPLPFAASAAGAVAAIAILLLLWRWYRRRREQAALLRAVTAGAFDHLRNVLLPDPQGVPLHFDFVLLTSRGLVVIDLRDPVGNVFGGDQMDEWTVMNGAQRYTFANPQSALFDRLAAVRLMAPETPIEGRVVFGSRSVFPKGLPAHARLLSAMAADFPSLERENVGELPSIWSSEWERVKLAARPSSLLTPRSAI
jgi:hypothetical protein